MIDTYPGGKTYYQSNADSRKVCSKAVAIIKSCVSVDQLNVALNYVNTAMKNGYINHCEWMGLVVQHSRKQRWQERGRTLGDAMRERKEAEGTLHKSRHGYSSCN